MNRFHTRGRIALIGALLTAAFVPAAAQNAAPLDGSSYFLPRTALRFTLLVEKSQYVPGELAAYSERYLREQVSDQPETVYRIVSVGMTTHGVPDTARVYTARIDAKHNITELHKSPEGLLRAINIAPPAAPEAAAPLPLRRASTNAAAPYLSQEMAAAGNAAAKAAIAADELFALRDSRSRLIRGEADNAPSGEAQLRLMLGRLDEQETALLQLFRGTRSVDTLQTVVDCIPDPAQPQAVLFRFSRHFGLTSADDLSGEPCRIVITDLHSVPAATDADARERKGDAGVRACLPGKIAISLQRNGHETEHFETYAAQFGRIEPVAPELFNKKVETKILFNTATGAIETITSEQKKQ